MDETHYKPLIDSINAQKDLMIQHVTEWCAINSGTGNLEGLAQIYDKLYHAFEPLGDSIEPIAFNAMNMINMRGENQQQTVGNALLIKKRPELSRRIILTGHMDTVFAPTHPFQKLTWLDDNTINGPGVADMKGGLAVMLQALTAFEQSPWADRLGWDVIINADEEIGSPASGGFFEAIAQDYQAGLVYEPAMTADGVLAKNRNGSGKLTLIAQGKAAHAGRAFYEGRNAICYLADAITRIHALNGKREGVTLNIGLISGGEALNIVPDKAVAKIDMRIATPEDEFWVRQALERIQTAMYHPDYQLNIEGHFGRPVKRVNQATEKLFQRIQALGKSLGLVIQWKDSGGCCDGNNLARHGLPVIDTLGVRGGNIHSSEEFILLDSLTERATLSAMLLCDLAKGGLEELHK